VSNIIILLLT